MADVYITKASKSASAILASKPNYDGFLVIVVGLSAWNVECMVSMHAAMSTLLDGACYYDWTPIKTPSDTTHWRKASLYGLTRKDWMVFLEGRGYRAGTGHLVMKHYRLAHMYSINYTKQLRLLNSSDHLCL